MFPRGGRDTQRRVRTHDGPTPRQHEVLTLVARGHCSAEIAAELGIKKSTVETHVLVACATLRARTRVQAAALVAPEANGSPTSTLTHDEQRVLTLLREGLAIGEAAQALHISRRTADRRLAAARTKLGVGTTAEAVVAVCPD
jgi:DNA-binding NarL/FixJ family response regulator